MAKRIRIGVAKSFWVEESDFKAIQTRKSRQDKSRGSTFSGQTMKMRLLLAEFRELYPDEVPWNTGEEGFVVWLEIVRRHEEVKLPKASIKRKDEDT